MSSDKQYQAQITQQLNRALLFWSCTRQQVDDIQASKSVDDLMIATYRFDIEKTPQNMSLCIVSLAKWFYSAGLSSFISDRVIKPSNYRASCHDVFNKAINNDIFMSILLGKLLFMIEQAKCVDDLEDTVNNMYAQLPKTITEATQTLRRYKKKGYKVDLHHDKYYSVLSSVDQLVGGEFVAQNAILPAIHR